MTFGIWRFRQTGVLLAPMTLTRWAIALSSILALAPLRAQDASATPPPAKPADVESQEAIMRAIYDVISGPAGPRDWNRFYSLMAPGARLIPTTHHKGDSATTVTAYTPQQFAERGQAYFDKNSFFEKELAHTTQTYGGITQTFSTYGSYHNAHDAKPFQRGINSFQLFNDGKRWYVVTIYWDAETPATPIPSKFLSSH